MNTEGRVLGISRLVEAIALRKAMNNWKWDAKTWNEKCHGGGFSESVEPTAHEIAIRLELAAFCGGDYTITINELVTFIKPSNDLIASLLIKTSAFN